MGKNLIVQRRGKGTHTFKALSHRYKGDAKFLSLIEGKLEGVVVDIVDCPGHSAPLMVVRYANGSEALMIAPEGIKVGDVVEIGSGSSIKVGNVLPLGEIPEGTSIYNIESIPGDGGKFCRASGSFAKVVGRLPGGVLVKLPSKKERLFNANCRACIGVVAGSGRLEKPFLKAGNKAKAMWARNKLYPRTSACKMNAVAHPFGNTRSARKSKRKPVSRNAPPGRKVGSIAARRTGRKKR